MVNLHTIESDVIRLLVERLKYTTMAYGTHVSLCGDAHDIVQFNSTNTANRQICENLLGITWCDDVDEEDIVEDEGK